MATRNRTLLLDPHKAKQLEMLHKDIRTFWGDVAIKTERNPITQTDFFIKFHTGEIGSSKLTAPLFKKILNACDCHSFYPAVQGGMMVLLRMDDVFVEIDCDDTDPP
jgi:hypothetical protein